jgi:hypothetical protein
MDQRIVKYILAMSWVGWPQFKPRPDGMQAGPNVVSTRSENGKSPFDSLNSLYLNTKGMFLAGNRSRQQRRPSSSGTQEENAARRRFSGDEAQKILRKAIRKSDAGTG